MGLSEKDIKKLWGLAAGRCSEPTCGIDCLVFLDENDPTVIGEMAHIIAKKPNGPRGINDGGDDTYENMILLCPTHHRIIDKAPENKFPPSLLLEWKISHEKNIRESINVVRYPSSREMALAIKRLLIKNYRIWNDFGPESETAKKNPISNIAQYWSLQKLSTIVPNNRKIIGIIERHEDMFEIEDYEICCEYISHANLFEQNCYSILETSKRFPQQFKEVIDKYEKIQ